MKYILLSIYILLLPLSFSTVYAQEEEVETEQTVETTLADELDIEEERQLPTYKFSFIEIVLAILAPLTFIVIGYLLIKKFKL